MELTLAELSIMLGIIDVCAQRGAFKGEELATVGELRTKLATVISQQQTTDGAEEQDVQQHV